MVCVILLASAALLGTFGIAKRQISAILITGVMYILAGSLSAIKRCRSSAQTLDPIKRALGVVGSEESVRDAQLLCSDAGRFLALA